MTEREDYLRAYIPAELLQRLEEAGGRIQGERRTVTVLFADTVGSTALGQALDPETYQSLMSQILGAMAESVVEFEGMVARLQGDGLLVERAEGNPFFLEELLRSLIDARLLEPTERGWRAGAMPGRIEVPDTVEGVIKARIDRLPAAPRQVLQAASVVGRIFSLPVLQAVTGLDGTLEGMLSELQRLDLVLERRRIPVREYGFRHALVQEVAYRGLLDSVRREMHLAADRELRFGYTMEPETLDPGLVLDPWAAWRAGFGPAANR